MFKDKINFKLVNILILVLIIYIGLNTAWFWKGLISKILEVSMPFILAFAIAYALYPLVRMLKKKKVGHKLAVTIVTVLVILISALLIVLTLPLVYEQLVSLSKSLGGIIQELSTNLSVDLGGIEQSLSNVVNELVTMIGKYVSDGAFQFVSKSVVLIVNMFVTFIVAIYFLYDMENIRKEIKNILKRKNDNERMFKYVKLLDKELGQYLTGLVIFMAIEMVEYTILFKIVGHPNWLLLGILTSLTTVIPYFGGLFTNIAAVILASVVSTPVFIGTLIVCLIFPQLDGYIISPKVYGKTNKIHPVWSIFALVAGGILFGFIGVMISLPVYIIINTTFIYFKDDIYDKLASIRK